MAIPPTSSSAPPLAVDGDAAVAGGRRLRVHLDVGGDQVPGVLLLPLHPRPAPAALLLHGYGSSKERMVESAGRSLLQLGVATLGIDLPLHGARLPAGGDGVEAALGNPLQLAARWRDALRECRAALGALAALPEIDAARIGLVGYSMGAYLGVTVAAAEPRVRATVLAAGGDLPDDLPFAPMVRAVVDPIRAIHRLAGRPVLLINGRHDRTIRPAWAARLHAAAREPRELLWYDGGHWLPDAVVRRAAGWLAAHLGEGAECSVAARRG